MDQSLAGGVQWQVRDDDIVAIAAAFGLQVADAPPQPLGGVTRRRYLGRRTGMRTLRSPALRGVSACEGGS